MWTEFLSVGRMDLDGRTERSVLFDTDDVDTAIAELDRQQAAIEGQPEATS
jgi:hypothetical protein